MHIWDVVKSTKKNRNAKLPSTEFQQKLGPGKKKKSVSKMPPKKNYFRGRKWPEKPDGGDFFEMGLDKAEVGLEEALSRTTHTGWRLAERIVDFAPGRCRTRPAPRRRAVSEADGPRPAPGGNDAFFFLFSTRMARSMLDGWVAHFRFEDSKFSIRRSLPHREYA